MLRLVPAWPADGLDRLPARNGDVARYAPEQHAGQELRIREVEVLTRAPGPEGSVVLHAALRSGLAEHRVAALAIAAER